MDTEELSAALRAAGLSPYQADAYVTLLDLGAASATDIAEESGVPAPRIYDVLRNLEGEGYVETYEQGSLRARAHSPADVLADLRERADRLEAAADEVKQRWEQPELESNEASIVSRFRTVLDRAAEIIRDAENQIQLSVTAEQFETLRPALVAAHERGVYIRVSLHTHQSADPPPAERFEGACTEARHRSLPAPFVTLVDRVHTCFSPHEESFNQYGVLVKDQTHTYVFHWYYLTCLWELWETIYSAREDEPPTTYVDIRQCVREIEPLLDDGATLVAHVDGHEVATGEPVEFTGRILDAVYQAGPPDRDPGRVLQLGGQVTITMDVDGREVTVGGWSAVVEDVEAARITVETASDATPPETA